MNLYKLIKHGFLALTLALVATGLSANVAPAQVGNTAARVVTGSSVCQSDGVTLAATLTNDISGFTSGFDLTVEGHTYSADDIPFGQSTTFTVQLPQLTSYPATYADGVQYLFNDDSDDMIDYMVLYPACEMPPVTTTTLPPETTTTTSTVPETTTSTTSTIPVETTTTTVPAVLVPEATTTVVPETSTSIIPVAIPSGMNQTRESTQEDVLALTGSTQSLAFALMGLGLLVMGVSIMHMRRTAA